MAQIDATSNYMLQSVGRRTKEGRHEGLRRSLEIVKREGALGFRGKRKGFELMLEDVTDKKECIFSGQIFCGISWEDLSKIPWHYN